MFSLILFDIIVIILPDILPNPTALLRRSIKRTHSPQNAVQDLYKHWKKARINDAAMLRQRQLPQLDRGPVPVGTPIEELEAADWVTPAPDARMFPDPARVAETRE